MDIEKPFYEITGGLKPRKYQLEAIHKLLKTLNEGKVLFIKLPTGYGKTEAAIIPYLMQMYYNEWFIAPGLIYVLPIRSLTHFQYSRIVEYVNNLKKILNREFNFNVIVEHGEIREKPFLFGDIVLTTLDTFLYSYTRASSYEYGHVDFPVGNIATSMIVFDEAHMYQDEYGYMISILNFILKVLSKALVPTVVMSATMPKIIEEKLFDEVDYEKVEYNYDEDYEKNSRRKIKLMLKERYDLQSFIREERAALISNTVNNVIDLFLKIKDSVKDLEIIHSRLTVKARKDRERKLKIKRVKGKLHFIATQVIESGIDVSVNLMISDLAPPDSLVQRLGRLVRFGGEGIAQIVKVEKPFPYAEKLLEATWHVLKSRDYDITSFADQQKFIDEVFIEANYETLLKSLDRNMRRSIEYLRNMHLLVYEQPEFRVRPTSYITVIVPEKEEYLNLVSKIKSNEEPLVDVKENYFNLDRKNVFHKGNLVRDFLLHSGEFLELKPCNGKFKVIRSSEVKPYRMYMLNPNSYLKVFLNNVEYDVGLKIP